MAAAAVLLGLVAPGHAAANVSVTLRVNAVSGAVPADLASCAVGVPEGSNGIAVLDAAKAAGCISSYETKTFPAFGTFVRCIDEVCGQPDGVDPSADGLLTFWLMSRNGASTSYGVDKYVAANGDVLGFSYTLSVVCFVPC